ncbi:hypothetical protein WN51_10829 [Melipona quadrifasciata]|uniref:Uncharacterized protein n=1 Tax=Melipona quadrifasciata TaxID=166423 RepID=A0A0M9A6K6_9HYME|nr:hypothetical protein WN51_10829 [Melipona quadrifasciata]
MRFLRIEPYKMFYKTLMNDDALFKTLDSRSRWGRPRNFNNDELTPLYKTVRPIATLKYNDLMDL